MRNDFDEINALIPLWDWCKHNRNSAWKFPEKWGVRGYRGNSPIGIVGDEPANRSLKHRERGLPHANDLDIFTHGTDKRLYALLKKYGLENAHLMDAQISVYPNCEQDERVFLKQIEILKLEALIIMGNHVSPLWKTVERYLKNWQGSQPRLYWMYHYSSLRWKSDAEWEEPFQRALAEIAVRQPNLATAFRLQ